METTPYYSLTFNEVQEGLIVYQDDFKGIDKDLLSKGVPITDWQSGVSLYVN